MCYSDSQTLPLDSAFMETVIHHNREFQRYAVDTGTYFAPVDEVILYPRAVLSAFVENTKILSPLFLG